TIGSVLRLIRDRMAGASALLSRLAGQKSRSVGGSATIKIFAGSFDACSGEMVIYFSPDRHRKQRRYHRAQLRNSSKHVVDDCLGAPGGIKYDRSSVATRHLSRRTKYVSNQAQSK